jgi:hypothetical protein
LNPTKDLLGEKEKGPKLPYLKLKKKVGIAIFRP